MPSSRSTSRAEAGSAYIVTLLALVVLTILALTLTLVTQSEVQIGGNEKTVNRLFYSSDALLSLAANKVLERLPSGNNVLFINRVHIGSGSSSANTADKVTLYVPNLIGLGPADLSIASIGQQQLYQTVQVITAQSQRVSWSGDAPATAATPVEVLGTKTLQLELIDMLVPQPPNVANYGKLQSNAGNPAPPGF